MNDCCKNLENHKLVAQKGDFFVYECKECSRKHYVLEVDPTDFKLPE